MYGYRYFLREYDCAYRKLKILPFFPQVILIRTGNVKFSVGASHSEVYTLHIQQVCAVKKQPYILNNLQCGFREPIVSNIYHMVGCLLKKSIVLS